MLWLINNVSICIIYAEIKQYINNILVSVMYHCLIVMCAVGQITHVITDTKTFNCCNSHKDQHFNLNPKCA